MNIRSYLFFSLVCLLSLNVITESDTQDRSTLGIAPKLAEQQTIKVPYNQGIYPVIQSTIAYICDALSNQFSSMVISGPGTGTLIGPLYEMLSGGAFANGNYYVCNQSNVLKTVSLINAQTTTIAPVTGITSGYVITSMAWKQPNGPMYISATNQNQSNLYTLNLVTGAASFVGNVSNCPALIFMSINCAGDCYGVDIVNDNTIKINLTTGAGMIIGATGIDANYSQSGAFDLSTNTLYWAAYNNTLGTAELRIINLLTGSSTMLITLSGRELTAFGISSSCPPIPACDISAGPFVSLPGSFNTGVSYSIKAKITNVGTASQSNIPVKFFVNETQYGTTQTIASLAPGAYDTNTVFNWFPAGSGVTTLRICSALGCDSVRSNDTISTTIFVGNPYVYCDNFDNLSNWTITNNSGQCVWASRPQRGYNLPPSAMGNCLSADADLCGTGTTMNTTVTLTNSLNCSNSYIFIVFDNDFYTLGSDQAKLDVSIDGGTAWSNVFTWTSSHRDTQEMMFVSQASYQPNVKIRFTYIAPGWDKWWAIDNLCLVRFWEGISKNGEGTPDEFSLSQNYPNPFNPSTVITYALPKACNVKITVYDVLGREVQTLVNEYKPAGTYEVTFDGSSLSSGLYFYRIIVSDPSSSSGHGFTDVKKMLMIK